MSDASELSPAQRRQLMDLCGAVGLTVDERAFDALHHLVAAGVPPDAVMLALRAMKDKRLEEAAARSGPAGAGDAAASARPPWHSP